MNTNKKGDIGLANVILDVTNKGYFLFLPFSDTTNVDMVIADVHMKLYRIQIKYISIDNSGVLNIVTSSVVNGKKIPIDLSKIDAWAIYCPQTNEVYYVSSYELVGKKSFSLRVNYSKIRQSSIRLAKDFLNIENALNNIAG